MNDQGVREIQLGGKQLVFIFMAGVVLLVVVFFLGVSVGRGVRERTGGGATVANAAAPTTGAVLPPATTAKPGELSYDKALQGDRGDAKGSPPPIAPPAPTATPTPTPTQTPPPAQTPAPPLATAKPTPTPTPTPAPAAEKAAPASAEKGPATPGTGWFVQVGLFRDRANAERVVRDLKSDGFAASLQPSGNSHRVRVGPYAERGQADEAAKRLAKYKPMVTR